MYTAFLIGRIIFGAYWLMNAYNHFTKTPMMSDYAASKSVFMPKVAVIGTGVLLLIGGLSMITGIWPTVGIIALIIFLLGVTPMMHDYWKVQDPMMRMGQQVNFNKNIALLAALLMMLAIAQPWMYAL